MSAEDDGQVEPSDEAVNEAVDQVAAEPPAFVPPPPDYNSIVAAAVRSGIEASRVQSTPVDDSLDPVKLWTFDPNLDPSEQARRFQESVDKVISARTAPLQEALRVAHGRLEMAERVKADDPAKASVKAEALKLLREGKVTDPDIAFELASTRVAQQAPKSVKTPNGPRAVAGKPLPSKAATPIQSGTIRDKSPERPRGLLNMAEEYKAYRAKKG